MKQDHKSKEQIIAEAEQKKLAQTRMAFINDKFMPEMEQLTNSLEEAQILVDQIKQTIQQGYQQKARDMKISDLGLEAMLNKAKRPELLQKHIKILQVLADQSIDDGIRLCDGLFEAVNEQIRGELKNRKLSDFKKDVKA